jgi:hypothetical protein
MGPLTRGTKTTAKKSKREQPLSPLQKLRKENYEIRFLAGHLRCDAPCCQTDYENVYKKIVAHGNANRVKKSRNVGSLQNLPQKTMFRKNLTYC